MKTSTLLCFLLLPTLVSTRGTSSKFSSPNMDRQCGQTIQLHGDSLPGTFFSFTSGQYKANLDCQLTIKAPTTTQRIIVVVERMDIACGGDKLLIYDGRVEDGTVLNTNQSSQCGGQKYYVRTQRSNTAILRFLSNNDGKVGNGFVVNAAIHFSVATCSRNDNLYRCRNHYCISNAFNCDDRNWCGDDTQTMVC